MDELITRDKVIAEIDQVPDHQLPELYAVIHDFKLRVGASQDSKHRIMQFAGSWADLPEEEFAAFLTEVRQRRHRAFTGRRLHETQLG